MKRRTFLRAGTASAVGLTTLAGCLGAGSMSGTLRIATYESFFGDDGTAGEWLKSEFESKHDDVTVEYTAPESGINEFIRRAQTDASIDADLYIGLNTGELVRVDQELPDTDLFDAVSEDLENDEHIAESLQIDPRGRALPYDTGFISLVYDKSKVENPGTFEALTTDEYQGDLIVQNAQNSDPGRAFLLWTINEYGPDGYLDYWQKLVNNDVKILGDWSTAYNAYMGGEAPMVVSYSTDKVFYAGQDDVNWDKHTIGFLNDQGYANPEAMARFADAPNSELAAQFMDFMLSKDAQAEFPERNVQFPSTTYDGLLSETFKKYAERPPEPVTFTYQDLAGNVNEWVDTWAKEIAGK